MTGTGTSDELSALEQAFFNDGYRLAAGIPGKGNSGGTLLQSMKNLYETLDGFIDLFLQQAATEQPAHCKKGCSWCCHQAVFAHTHEFRYLKNWMFANMDAEQMEGVRKKAETKHKSTSGLSPEEKLLYKAPCPLLVNGACSAYAARPVACRIYLSMDVKSCEHEYAHPADRSAFPKLFRLPLQAGRKLNQGFAARLNEAGMENLEYTVEEGLLL